MEEKELQDSELGQETELTIEEYEQSVYEPVSNTSVIKDSNQDEPQEPSNDENQLSDEKSEEGEESFNELSDAEFRALVTSKFKANGKDLEVTDPYDIVKLMQFGANYHKKMAELAPNRKLLKALNDNGLLSEDKINDLISIAKGDRAAIAKLIKDNEIDTFDLPDLEETPYQRTDYIPTDESVSWDEVKEDMLASNEGKQVLSYISQVDLDSFSLVREDPTILQTLRSHVESGIYQKTMDKIDYLRMTGNLPEYDNEGNRYKDLDVYAYFAKQIEDGMTQSKPKVVGNNLQQSRPVQNSGPKQSASIPSNQVTQTSTHYSDLEAILNMSDEEAAKYDSWEEFLMNRK